TRFELPPVDVNVDRRARHRHGIDRTRQALAEWRRRELQRQVSRRVSEPRMVSFARRGKGSDRRMAATLQRGTSAFEPRLSHAERVRGSRSNSSAPSCNGPGRSGIRGLRAPARCSSVPAGTNAASKGSRLKLTVVRRIWAGQSTLNERRYINSSRELTTETYCSIFVACCTGLKFWTSCRFTRRTEKTRCLVNASESSFVAT